MENKDIYGNQCGSDNAFTRKARLLQSMYRVEIGEDEGTGPTRASKRKYGNMISVAIITYCLVAIVQHNLQLKCSTYEVLQILGISLTDKIRLRDLFGRTNFNDVKDLNDPLISGPF